MPYKSYVDKPVVLFVFLDYGLEIRVAELEHDVLRFLALIILRVENVKHLHAVHTPLQSV